MSDEIVYTVFHDDGPIRLTETELCNGYMRMREALQEIANGDARLHLVRIARTALAAPSATGGDDE
jgi:hypothetical protein